MSCLSCYRQSVPLSLRTFGKSITLLNQSQIVEDGRFVSKSEFEEVCFAELPYSSTSIDEYSINALSAYGANPRQIFYQSNDVDSVVDSVNRLNSFLTQQSNEN